MEVFGGLTARFGAGHDLILWKDPKKSGIVVGAVTLVYAFFFFTKLPLLSIFAYALGLAVSACIAWARVGRSLGKCACPVSTPAERPIFCELVSCPGKASFWAPWKQKQCAQTAEAARHVWLLRYNTAVSSEHVVRSSACSCRRGGRGIAMQTQAGNCLAVARVSSLHRYLNSRALCLCLLRRCRAIRLAAR